ncbi:MAG: caspase domain-containing protein [Burkholderiales bacterium]
MRLRLTNAMGFIACLAAVLAFGGAAQANDRDRLGLGHLDIESRDLAAAPGGAATVTVMAAEGRWQSTGALLRKGNTYRITASGQWQQGFLCSASGPSGEGSGCFPPIPIAALAGLPIGTLIGKVGKEGAPFPVGAEREFTPQADGVLYLRDNDIADFSFDNTGFVNVKVAVVAAATPPAPPVAAAAPPTAARPATPEPARTSATPLPSASAQYWAVIIGVSEYADTRIPSLRYAAKDARAIHDWLVSPQGGRYAPARVKLLVDRDATGNNIREALFGWLRQAIEEDVVMIFFAGHGSPDAPDTPGNLYLLPTDARYDAIASSGFPMWDIETALKRFVKAKRVVVVADACHSGGVGESFDIARRSTSATPSNPISSGLHGLAAIGPGVAVLSASDDKQFSAEGPMFGGGHGVFTHFLLEGLKGQADYNQDQRVTLGELIPFLSENVRRATRNTQSPTVAGRFDPALSIGR